MKYFHVEVKRNGRGFTVQHHNWTHSVDKVIINGQPGSEGRYRCRDLTILHSWTAEDGRLKESRTALLEVIRVG